MDERIIDRFWAKVNKSGPRPTSGDAVGNCWAWTASTDQHGYGCFGVGKSVVKAPRISWEIAFGPIPKSENKKTRLCVLHRCDNPACVNPTHLFLGTQADNMLDKVRKGRANSPRGESAAKAKLTNEEVLRIRAEYAAGCGLRALGRRYGVYHSAIFKIVRMKSWRHL